MSPIAMRWVAALLVVLLVGPFPLSGQTGVADPELAAGIRQAEAGDYAAAALTLDVVAQRLAKEPARAKDLARAYLYLGIAYFGLGQVTAAKARFQDALVQSNELHLSPEEFSPKIIELFEVARQEARPAKAAAQAEPRPVRPAFPGSHARPQPQAALALRPPRLDLGRQPGGPLHPVQPLAGLPVM